MEGLDLLKVVCVFAVLQCIGHGVALSESLDCHTRIEGSESSCSVTNVSCLSDHPPDVELQECQDLFTPREPTEMPSYAQECPRLGVTQYYDRCDEVVDHTPAENEYFLIHKVHSKLLSLDPQHFAVNVSWDYPNATAALTRPPPSKRLRGYEVRIWQNNSVVGCWCLLDPNISSIWVGMGPSPRFQYKPFKSMKVEVYTLPFDPYPYPESYYLTFESRNWPTYCNDTGVLHSAESCTAPLVTRPHNVSATTAHVNSTKELTVTWSHFPTAPPPHVYYVYGTSESSNFSVVVNETRQVTVSGLKLADIFTVRVEGYSPCSGTSSFISAGFTGGIGCGGLSGGVMESTNSPPGDTTTTLPTTCPPDTTTTSTTHPFPNHSLVIPLILTGLVVLLLVVITPLAILLGMVLYRCHHKPSPFPVVIDSDYKQLFTTPPKDKQLFPKVKPEVLVVYSLKTPKSEQELIERYIVARLIGENYHVNSCNDHTEKTIMQWVEEQARQAHTVLIVCNKSFHSEWNSKDRGPLLNSLIAIINSAVSHDSISKYGTVLLESGSDQYIPDNLYIKGMTKFVVEMDEDADVEDVISFLKKNNKFQI